MIGYIRPDGFAFMKSDQFPVDLTVNLQVSPDQCGRLTARALFTAGDCRYDWSWYRLDPQQVPQAR